MSKEKETISELVWRIVKDRLTTPVYLAKVTAVEGTESATVDREDDGPTISARLTATLSTKDTRIVAVPKVGSYVTVALIGDEVTQPVVINVSEIDEVVIDSPKMTLNGGSFGGLIKIQELTSQLNKVEQKVNQLITAFNVHVHPETGVTTAPAANAGTVPPLTTTQRSSLENDKVKHG